MNDMLFRTILKRYEAEIEDAHYKIDALCEHNLVINTTISKVNKSMNMDQGPMI